MTGGFSPRADARLPIGADLDELVACAFAWTDLHEHDDPTRLSFVARSLAISITVVYLLAVTWPARRLLRWLVP